LKSHPNPINKHHSFARSPPQELKTSIGKEWGKTQELFKNLYLNDFKDKLMEALHGLREEEQVHH